MPPCNIKTLPVII